MRLTKKIENNEYHSSMLENMPPDPLVDRLAFLDKVWQKERNKLGQLEDIEDKLGIELKIIGTALTLGIYTKKWGFIDKDNLSFNRLRVRIISKCIELPFVGEQGYGKTWALTPGELL